MIPIPQSSAREQAENELAQWVLDNTKDRESVQILQRTASCCAGNWCGNTPHTDHNWHKSSFEAVDSVIREFRKQGWQVTEVHSSRYPTAYITFER